MGFGPCEFESHLRHHHLIYLNKKNNIITFIAIYLGIVLFLQLSLSNYLYAAILLLVITNIYFFINRLKLKYALKSQITALIAEKKSLENNLKQLSEISNNRLSDHQEIQKKMQQSFDALSHKALLQNSESFLNLAKVNFNNLQVQAKNDHSKNQEDFLQMIAPLKDHLDKVEQNINILEKNRQGAYHSIYKQLDFMQQSYQNLCSETQSLSQSLQSPNISGMWGEVQLKRVVELAGMIQYCDFFSQKSIVGQESVIRPDLLIKMPSGKSVIVDAKVSLSAYMRAHQSKSSKERIEYMKSHADNIKRHVMQLSKKNYWQNFNSSPEFVVLFLPGESFFSAALSVEPNLIEQCSKKSIIIATPTTLIALLKTIAYSWKENHINENAKAISQHSVELLQRIHNVMSHLQKLGRSISTSADCYDKTINSIKSRVVPTIKKISKLHGSELDLSDSIKCIGSSDDCTLNSNNLV